MNNNEKYNMVSNIDLCTSVCNLSFDDSLKLILNSDYNINAILEVIILCKLRPGIKF